MLKLMIAIVLLAAACGNALAQGQEPLETATRFGPLTVGEDRMLLFNGRPLSPPVEGNNSLDLGEAFRIGERDVVLVTNNGGTACPYLYYFVTVSASSAKATPPFGTCAELSGIKRTGNSISLTMQGFRGPFEPAAEQRRAARRRHVFIYRAGVVTENGKPVK